MSEYICTYCNKVCKNQNSLKNHECRCKSNPNRVYKSYTVGLTAWNKGKTKKTDDRVKKNAESISSAYKTGKVISWNKGKTKNDSIIIKSASENISRTVQNKVENGTWHSSFSKTHTYIYKGVKLMGTWELKFAMYLDSKSIKWSRPVNRIPYIFENKNHYYTPDFYLSDYDLYIEIKGMPTEKDFAKWREFRKYSKLDIWFGDEIANLGIDIDYKDVYNNIPEEFRRKHIDLI